MAGFWFALLATFLISLLSLLGVVSLFYKAKELDKVLFFVIAFAAGSLLGDAFLHLIPEAYETLQNDSVFLLILLGFGIFFILEKLLHWHHYHHTGKCSGHVTGQLNLIGDGIHNFMDGLMIAASFRVSVNLGVASTLAVALHEIPQEIGDFAVLLYSGFGKMRALLFNFLSALLAVVGAVVGWWLLSEATVNFLLPVIAGGFIYIAATDLVPELHKENEVIRSVLTLFFFAIGILVMFWLKQLVL